MNSSIKWLSIGIAMAIGLVELLSACTSSPTPTATVTVTATPTPTTPAATGFTLTSSAFKNGELIPLKYTCQSDNVSPPLAWTPPPQGTQSLALTAEDMDGPSGIIVHWVIFNIPASSRSLPEAVVTQASLADGFMQGVNIRGAFGYTGPCPPAGTTHRYVFTLFALDKSLDLKAGATRAEFFAAAQGHILGEAPLVGIFRRSG